MSEAFKLTLPADRQSKSHLPVAFFYLFAHCGGSMALFRQNYTIESLKIILQQLRNKFTSVKF